MKPRWITFVLLTVCIGVISISLVSIGCEEETNPYPSRVVSEDWYTILFAPVDEDEPESIQSYLLELIDGAKQSILAAVYDIDHEGFATALVDAKKRGVEVQVLIEKDYSDPDKRPSYPILNDENLVKTDPRDSALMHNKFLVVDSRFVWTGSTNLTQRGLNFNNNNVIMIESLELAENYETEFYEMWNDDRFGITSPSDTPYPLLSINDVEIECYFAPEDSVEDEILKELEGASYEILFATFTFTSDPIEELLISKWEEGVQIKGILESFQSANNEAYEELIQRDIPVIKDGNDYTMHHKFFVIDRETVVTGSYNPTKSANTRNDENILVLHDSEIAEAYHAEFSAMWEEWYET
ncbi:MAG: phospholipase D-like domain-containing protein [Chloroflexota bacterium]|nr:phospholipase D-like domain-containing protein [Chloroflexota bacterium]